MRSRWYSGVLIAEAFSQERDRPDAPSAGVPCVTIVTPAPRLARCTAQDTPRMPAPTTTTRLSDRRLLRIGYASRAGRRLCHATVPLMLGERAGVSRRRPTYTTP